MPRLRRRIAPGLRSVRTGGFPARHTEKRPARGVEIWLGIGGNLGDTIRRFQRLRFFLMRQNDLKLIESSPILINPPFGYLEQPEFANAVLRLRAKLPPLRLLRRMQEVERRFGRRRSFKDAPRTLDIDLLFYGDRRIDHPRLTIPHPGWSGRLSVLWPSKHLAKPPRDRRMIRRRIRRVMPGLRRYD